MALAAKANQYIDEQAPWVSIKDPELFEQTHQVCSLGINLFRILMIYLQPVLPTMAKNAQEYLNDSFSWAAAQNHLSDHEINKYKALIGRVDPKKIEQMVEASKENLKATSDNNASGDATADSELGKDPISDTINFDDFAKIDLRVVKIVNAEHVDGAKKLLKLTLSLGEEESGEQRQVFAGIKSAYQPEDLIGKLTVMVANLEPRKMRFGMSEGMVLAAGPGGKDIYVLNPDEGAKPGMRVM